MTKAGDESEPRYVVVTSDRYEAEREAYGFQLIGRVEPSYSERWLDGLAFAVAELPNFPGPLSHARDEEASAVYQCEVRRLLYHGPGRRSKQPVRILFRLITPAEDDPEGETMILLLRLLRGGQAVSLDEPVGGEIT